MAQGQVTLNCVKNTLRVALGQVTLNCVKNTLRVALGRFNNIKQGDFKNHYVDIDEWSILSKFWGFRYCATLMGIKLREIATRRLLVTRLALIVSYQWIGFMRYVILVILA